MASDDALRRAFSSWDKNGDGYIDKSEIREVLAAAGVPQDKLEKLTQEVVDKTDVNRDGRISFDEFKSAMASTPLGALAAHRGVLGKESVDVFYREVIAHTKTQRPPVVAVDGVLYIHVRQQPGLYFVLTLPDGGVSALSAPPAFTLELLCRAASVLRDFCGSLTEEALRRNVVLAYELLDELFDWGYPQATSTEQLRPLVHTPARLAPTLSPASASLPLPPSSSAATAGASASTPVTAGAAVELVERKVGEVLERLGGTGPATATVQSAERSAAAPGSDSGPAAGTSRQREEVFVDLIEKLTATFAPSGNVFAAEATGALRIRNFLSPAAAAAPEAVVALGDLLGGGCNAECNFSSAVRADGFAHDRTLRIALAPGETTAMNYRVANAAELPLPFRVHPFVDEVSSGSNKLTATIKVVADIPADRQAVNVVVRLPVPRAALSVFCESTAGIAEYRREDNAVVCSLSSVQGGVEFAVRAGITLEKPTPGARREIGPVELSFEIPSWTATRAIIRSVQVEDRGGRFVKCFRWTRTLTTSTSYTRRIF